LHIESEPRFEPLPIGIDQTDQRNRRIANERRELGQLVKTLLRFGVENLVRAQRPQSLGLIARHRVRHTF
jgi:hypothetical protein